jgi:hypothetical protein
VDGLTQETCRDNAHHAQYAMASAFQAAEVAWHQGVDVYTPHQKRFTATLELMGKQIATGSMQGTCADDATTSSRFATWEIGYNHYHNRMGLELPDAWTAITQQIRPKGVSDWNIFFETLTHGDLQATSGITSRAAGTPGIRMRSQGQDRIMIVASEGGRVDLLVTTVDGRKLENLSVELTAGAHKSIRLHEATAESGLRIVRARTSQGETNLLLPN